MPTRTPTPTDFLPLSSKDLHILFGVAVRPLHGYGLVTEVEERSGGTVRLEPANLYRRLHRMVDAGLLEETAPPPEEEGVDERRRYYAATELGRKVLARAVTQLESLVSEAAERGLVPDRGGS